LLEAFEGVKAESMTNRSRGMALGFGLAFLSGPVSAQLSAAPRATTAPKAIVAPAPLAFGGVRDLYSARARRLVRAYLRLQMLELRKTDLDRVRAVIEGKLGVDTLFSLPPMQAGGLGPGR
jgi:hypothetical protein